MIRRLLRPNLTGNLFIARFARQGKLFPCREATKLLIRLRKAYGLFTQFGGSPPDKAAVIFKPAIMAIRIRVA